MLAFVTIDGTTKLTGIAGWPVGHSRSPAIHNYWCALHGLNAAYVPLPIAPDRFRAAIEGLQAAGFRGVNITLPHKQAALDIATMVDPSARRIGAANVLSFEPDGNIIAANTDGSGFMQALKNGAPQWRVEAGPAVVLGAGGAARAVVSALIDAGVGTIRIVNRSRDNARALQDHLGHALEIYGWDDDRTYLADATLLVNTTSLGMQGQPKLALSLENLPPGAVINDLVYAPLQTDLLVAARARGLVTVDGLGMLLHQAAAAFHIWFGVTPVVDAALRSHILK